MATVSETRARISTRSTTTRTTYGSSFYDVTFGNNGVVPCQQSGTCPKGSTPTPAPGYTAGTGYDHVTGIGVPFARHLIQAVVGV